MSNPKYKRWMVGLDFTDLDSKIINRVSHLSKILKPKIIHFVHVEKELEIPIYIPEELKEIVPTADEQYQEKMQETITANFDNEEVKWEANVVSGKTFDILIDWLNKEKIDFFIAGYKKREDGSGFLSHKILRSLACPALFIPPVKMPGSKKILVPIDFSEHSRIALETALEIAEGKDIEVECLHIYTVPLGYYKTGKSYDEFAEIMKANAIKEFQHFSHSHGVSLDLKCRLLEKGAVAEIICSECKEGEYDLVMIGSKGQSGGSVVLLGSTAEKLIQINQWCMTWIVKKKDEHIGFFKALSKI